MNSPLTQVSDTKLAQSANDLLLQLSTVEKINLCTGKNFWQLHGIERLDLPSIWLTDGPHGLRKQRGSNDHIGLNDSVPATCFPTAVGLASSWNRELLLAVGTALGEACVAEDISVLLGPGVNIKRSPLCGRNFEYFSEDPYLSGQMGKAWVQGVQSRGVGTSLKHFAANNQEAHRMVIDTIVDERSLREIYLPGFEITVKEAQPWTVMCAYNRVNGAYASENTLLLTQILKEEWGHTGLVVSDWGACNDRTRSLAAGMELEMPGNGCIHTPAVQVALESGELSPEQLDAAAVRVIELILKSKPALDKHTDYDRDAQHLLAMRAAEESCVLLKNEDGVLPLGRDEKIAVIGALASTPRYQGSGSSQITPTRLDLPLQEIQNQLGIDRQPTFAPGYTLADDAIDQQLIKEAVAIAATAETVLLFAGLPDAYESEGFDREHMRLPASQLNLIAAVAPVSKRLVIVLQNGAPVELPFVGQAQAILESYLGGQAGGSAVARVLFGDANPSGRLAETFPLKLEDSPCNDCFPGEPRQVQYREGLWVGYRYFDSTGTPVAFPFGHGLSYTTFAYSRLKFAGSENTEQPLDGDSLQDWSGFSIECQLENTGSVAGYETAQLYVGKTQTGIFRPQRELRGFEKIWLEPGETRTVHFELGRRAFSYWCTQSHSWSVEAGEHQIEVGASSADIRLHSALELLSTDNPETLADPALRPYFEPGKRLFDAAAFAALLGHPAPTPLPLLPYHSNSTIGDIQATVVGRLLHKVILRSVKKMVPSDRDEKMEQMMAAMLAEMPLRNLVLMSGGKFPPRLLQICIQLMNGHYLPALNTLAGR